VLTCGEQTARTKNWLRWPASSRNRGRFQIGMVAGIKSESPAGLNRNSQPISFFLPNLPSLKSRARPRSRMRVGYFDPRGYPSRRKADGRGQQRASTSPAICHRKPLGRLRTGLMLPRLAPKTAKPSGRPAQGPGGSEGRATRSARPITKAKPHLSLGDGRAIEAYPAVPGGPRCGMRA
jgi:hypothetical protein